MKRLNDLIKNYTNYLQTVELQTAYKAIIDFMNNLKNYFKTNFPDYLISGLYQGYMDMSYFSIANQTLKAKGLKIAIVYLHVEGVFEVWLSAQNRKIAKQYIYLAKHLIYNNQKLYHNRENLDAIVESVIIDKPNFENIERLVQLIEDNVSHFIALIMDVLDNDLSSS